jgi:hypothetical protein
VYNRIQKFSPVPLSLYDASSPPLIYGTAIFDTGLAWLAMML